MSHNTRKQATSPETEVEASRMAKGTQKPGQTKEQTRLIAKGIQKGIEQYKKQHKAKSRELDKRLKSSQKKSASTTSVGIETQIVYRQHWLAWSLLAISWFGAGIYFYLL